MNLSPVAQTLQLIAWFLALAEFIVALYVLLLNAWHTSNRHVGGLFLTFAINNIAIGLMIGAVDATQAALPTYLLAVTSPAIQPGIFLAAVVLLKPRWLQGAGPFGLSLRTKPVEGRGRWRWGWWLVYGLTFLPVLLTLVDAGLGTQLWYTGLDAATYGGGYVSLREYANGSLSLLIRVLSFYGISVVTFIPLLYVALRDKQATSLTRRLAWLLLGAQIASVIIQMGLQGLLDPAVRVIITGTVLVLAYAYAGFQQMISERRLQRGRLQTRLTALILVIAVPILVAVVAYVSTRAGALIEQAAVQQQEPQLLNALLQFQRVSWTALAVGVAMLLILAWSTIHQAFRPIAALTETAVGITNGDLTRTAPVESEDEIGILARAFNQMTEQLRGLIGELEQRVAERTCELRASEKRFRDLAESTADWIWEVDAAGHYTYCSESVVNVLGYTPEQILGKTPFELMPPDEAARVGEVFAQIAADKQPIVDLENRNLAQDGREVVVLTNGVPILDDEGNLLGYRGVDKDVTERVEAESRVQERRTYLEAVLRAAPDAIVTLDAQHRIVEWNLGAESLFGYSRQEVIGQNIDDLITNPDTYKEAVGLSQVITDGDDVPPTEVVRYRKDGSPVDVIAAGSPILAGDKLIGVVAVYTDISERKQAEEEIKRRGAELEALQEISLAITGQLELDELLQNVVERGCRLLNVEAGGVYLVDEARGDLALVVGHGFAKDHTGVRLRPGEGIAGKVLQSGELLVVDDYRRWEGRSPDWEAEPLTAVLGMPLERGGQVAGVLNFSKMAQARSFDEHDVWLATLFANQAAIAIENARLYEEIQQELAEREQAEKETRRLKEFNESIVQSMVEGIIVQDAEGYFSFVNPAAVAMLGYTPDELLGQHWTMTVPPSQQPIVQAADERRARGETDQYELELVRKNGTRLSVLISGNPRFERDNFAGTLSVFTDVTELKRAEKALEQRAAQLMLLSDVGGRIAALMDLDSMLDRTARLVQESFGYHHVGLFTLDRGRDELVMRTRSGDFTDLFPPDHRLKVGQGMVGWAALHGETLLANDVNSNPRYVNLYPDVIKSQSELCVPIRVSEQVVGVLDVQSTQLDAFDENDVLVIETLADQIAVAIENARLYEAGQQELAERKRAERQLQRYATELEQTNEEVKQFAYIVSHDLRAPLVNLKGFAAELRAALAVIASALITTLPHLDEKKQQTLTMAIQEDVPEALGFIDSSVTRMDRFVNAVLKLSRLGRRELKLEPVDMDVLVQTTLQTLAHQIEERKVSVVVESLPEVVADRTSMEQVLGNLLNNALIYLDPDRPGEIEITAEPDHDKTKFHVRDNGRGIAERDMDKVFAPFRRAGRQDVPGEGMGLPYVQTLIRRHGGRIWVESELGKGSTFYFTIPANLRPET